MSVRYCKSDEKNIDKVSNVHFPDKNRERELEVVHGEDDDLLLPLPGGEAHLPHDQTRLKIKDINLTEFWDLLGDFPVEDGQNAFLLLPSEASPF